MVNGQLQWVMASVFRNSQPNVLTGLASKQGTSISTAAPIASWLL